MRPTNMQKKEALNQSSRPFNYSLRVSARARNVRLAVKPYLGLEVVIPKRFPQKQIAGILQQHEAWIIKQLEKHQHSLSQIELPQNIQIALSQENLPIIYTIAGKPGLVETNYGLEIRYQSEQQVIDLLRNWLRYKAKQTLPPMLTQIATEFGFNFKKVSIRSQKSRWGSCSSSGTISLNDQLLFMPADTVRYLMIHELCHTRFMNHSRNFWALVQSCCPDYRVHDLNLAKGREHVPRWFSASLFKR